MILSQVIGTSVETLRRSVMFHMRREEKPTRCHLMVYCTYYMLNMFRASLCSRLYVCYYRLWCAVPWLLVVGGQVQGSTMCPE